MQTIDEAREHCRFVGKGIEKMVADGVDFAKTDPALTKQEKGKRMKRIVKCCLAVALGFAAVGCSKNGGHKKVQLWKDGPYWAETNIGADNPWDYGYYFWWGDTIGYKRVNDAWVASNGSSSSFSFSEENTTTYGKSEPDLRREERITADATLAPKHDAAHVHWGGEWRMPTEKELKDLCLKCDWERKALNGVEGYVVRGRGDYASASIFLPCAGFVNGTSLIDGSGRYWSSVPRPVYDNDIAWLLYFSIPSRYHNASHDARSCARSHGLSVRPVQGLAK